MRLVRSSLSRDIVVAGIVAGALAVSAAPAAAQTPAPVPTPTTGVATLQPDGSALAPADAPPQVRKAINAGNKIRTKPYLWGGGHRSFKAKGYDCSGAVSYLLHAAGLLKRPLASGPLATSWGSAGVGQWITVYANKGHTYIVVAGLRYDTSAVGEPVNNGSGPRWRSTARTTSGYTSKYWPSL